MARFFVRVGLAWMIVFALLAVVAGNVGRAMSSAGEIRYIARHTPTPMAVYSLDPLMGIQVKLRSIEDDVSQNFSWSPDGQYIAYLHENETILLNLETGTRSTIPTPNSEIHWLPETSGILLEGSLPVGQHTGIFHISMDGSNVQRISPNNIQSHRSPSISPDGTEVLFLSYGPEGSAVYRANLDGSHLRPLIESTENTTTGRWSPDGQWIAFQSLESGSTSQVYVMAKDDSSSFRVDLNGTSIDDIYWSPDGTALAFRALVAGDFQPIIVTLDGHELRLPASNTRFDIGWSPDSQSVFVFSFSPSIGSWIDLFDARSGDSLYHVQGYNPIWSPEGNLLTYVTGREICLLQVKEGSERCESLTGNFIGMIWLP